jgi:ferredoxin
MEDESPETQRMFAIAYEKFQQLFPDSTTGELDAYFTDTVASYQTHPTPLRNMGVLLDIFQHEPLDAILSNTGMVVQVGYERDDGVDNIESRNAVIKALERHGFELEMACMSRACFSYKPGEWTRFKEIVKRVARTNRIKIKRVLLVFVQDMSLSFAYPEDTLDGEEEDSEPEAEK